MVKKRILGTTMIVAMLALSSGQAIASSKVPTSGEIDLTNAPVTNSMLTPFSSVNVGGGVWDYGTSAVGLNQKQVWSNYNHPTLVHSSSCSIGTLMSQSGKTAKGTTSYSSAVGSWGDTTHAYWNTY